MQNFSHRFLGILRGESFLFFAVWIFLLFAGRSAMLRDPGSFWHVAAGERMLSTGQVLRVDPFSFTRAGCAWVDDQWLAECGMAAMHRLAGWEGLLLITTALLAGIFTWIAVRLMQIGLDWLPTCALLAVVLLVGSPQFHVRPLVLTIVLLGITFAWLIDVEAGRKPLRQLWWFVPLCIVWTNLHGGVLAGIGTVGLCAVGWLAAWTLGKKSPIARRGDAIELVLLLAALVAATLVNPCGVGLPRDWLTTLTMPLPQLIDEHAPLSFATPVGWAVLLLGIGYAAAVVACCPGRMRATWLVPLVWFGLALLRVRNAPLFGVTAALALADVLPESRIGQWLRRREMLGAVRPAVGWRAAVLPLIVVVAAVMLQTANVHVPVIGRGWARLDPDRWPVDLLPELAAIEQSAPDGTPIFNDLNFGGFLIYHAPRLRVFVDDRCSLYGTEFLGAYDLARREKTAEIERWRRQYGFSYALVASGGRFDGYLAGAADWTLLGRSPAAALYRWRMGDTPPAR